MKLKIWTKNLKTWGYKLVKATKNILFPLKLTCNLCGREVFDGCDFCPECEKQFILNDSHVCNHCGRKTSISMDRCLSCKGEWEIDRARSLYVYADAGKEIIRRYKFRSAKYLAEIFAPKLCKLYVENGLYCQAVMGVPMTADKVFQRGYNQSEELAKKVAEIIGVPFIKPIEKVRETSSQVGLKIEERKRNLAKSFKLINGDLVKDKVVLICDDVLTTGSTSGEIAKLLKKAKAKSVILLTVCSTPDEILPSSQVIGVNN